MKFGENLKEIRKAKKISQEELAEKIGVSRQSISKWETGENYPSMNNIICLCDVFKCKMNDIVHEDFLDINFLDEEIKMKVAKLNKEEQHRVKVLSKILLLVGRIGAIILKVGIGFVIFFMVMIPILINNIDVKNNKIVSIGNTIKIEETKKGLLFSLKGNEKIVLMSLNHKDIVKIKDAYQQQDKIVLITLLEISLTLLIAFMILVIKVLNHLEKLFNNIHQGETPFTLDNIDHIKKMSYFMIASIITASLSSIFLNIAMRVEDAIEFNLFNIIEIIFLYSMSYIFEYGYQIQKDSKGIMIEK